MFTEEAFQSYLIEEFLEGDSFYDLIREKGHLNQDTVIRYGIQICDLVQYLHSAEQIPILYLDLQPKNLLVCHEQVKLLDFDHADFLDGANRELVRFGTPGYAAPEQSGDMELGVYTDVYQIGALLFWLLTGETMERGDIRKVPGKLGRILRTCTRENREKRYGSVHLIQEDLKRLDTRTNGSGQRREPLLYVRLPEQGQGWELLIWHWDSVAGYGPEGTRLFMRKGIIPGIYGKWQNF